MMLRCGIFCFCGWAQAACGLGLFWSGFGSLGGGLDGMLGGEVIVIELAMGWVEMRPGISQFSASGLQ